jgi:hypothetical protein
MSNTKQQVKKATPERRFGRFIAVWRNTIQTADGERDVRSVTISAARYRDAKTGECVTEHRTELKIFPA